MWHYSRNECPAETYNPNLDPGRPGKMRAKGHPGPPAPGPVSPTTPPKATPTPTSTITLSDEQASVTKGSPAKVAVVQVDYIVDGPHTKALWNFGFRLLYWGHVKLDEWVFDWHKHIPKEQFQLTKNAEMSIELDPRNLYSRATTWFTKNVCRAKNLQQAHAAIDGILFFEAFGGISVAVVFHYEYVYLHSPKTKARREAKALAKFAKQNHVRPEQVVVSQTATTEGGLPIFSVATSEGATA